VLNHAPNPLSASTGPIDVDTAFGEARGAEDDGRWEEAVRLYQQAIALKPDLLEARNNLGRLYVRLSRVAAAIVEFRTVLAMAPDYALARNNLGSAFLLDGNEHIQEFLEAVRLDGTYATPYYNLASVYARRGDTSQALGFLTKALSLEPAVVSWVQEDPDFASVKEAPEFQRWRSVRTVQR
jgi:tetratricopeptide (TPR) repeat protein